MYIHQPSCQWCMASEEPDTQPGFLVFWPLSSAYEILSFFFFASLFEQLIRTWVTGSQDGKAPARRGQMFTLCIWVSVQQNQHPWIAVYWSITNYKWLLWSQVQTYNFGINQNGKFEFSCRNVCSWNLTEHVGIVFKLHWHLFEGGTDSYNTYFLNTANIL